MHYTNEKTFASRFVFFYVPIEPYADVYVFEYFEDYVFLVQRLRSLLELGVIVDGVEMLAK